jgi:hypothetical protein
MKVGIIQNKVEFSCTYDERERMFNIQIPESEIRKNLIDKPHGRIVDVFLEIVGVESEAKE